MDRIRQLSNTAHTLLRARQGNAPIESLNGDEVPVSMEEVYVVQDTMAAAIGAIGGWKIGAPSATETPFFAPMPEHWMAAAGRTVQGEHYRLRGVEAEIAFQIGADLRPRDRRYTREEIASAIAQCVPAIELLESAYVDPLKVPRLTMFSDLQMHGGFVAGQPIENWHSIDWSKEQVTQTVSGGEKLQRVASNPAGTDLMRLLEYLANEGAGRTGGLRKGQWVTTGSWTGATWLKSGQSAKVQFTHSAPVTIQFG